MEFLAEAESGKIATRPPRMFKPRDLPPYVHQYKKHEKQDMWVFSKAGRRTYFSSAAQAIEYATEQQQIL